MNRVKFRAVAAAAAVTAASLSACAANSEGSGGGGTPESGGTLRVGMVGESSSLDIIDSQIAPLLTGPSLESLVRLKSDGSLEPWLAESVENPSPTEYVYHLRDGVTFWDGEELTADDVVFSLERLRDTASYTSAKYKSVDTIEPTDPATVTVTLKTPDSNWPVQASMFSSQIIQKKFYEEHEDDFGNPGTLIMGTGPYEVTKLDPSSGVTYQAYSDYWGGQAEFDTLELSYFDTETNAALALRAKSVDVVPSISSPDTFKATSKAELVSGASCSIGFLAMNTQVEPWSDVHVRRAVAFALDRSAFVDDVDGYAEPITTFIPPNSLKPIASDDEIATMVEGLPQYPHDIEAAKAELAKSEYPDGFSGTLPTTEFSNNVTGSQIVAEQLSEIGIDLEVKNQPIGTWVAGVSAAVEDRPTVYTAGQGCSPTPGYMPSYWLGSQGLGEGGTNLAGYGPESVDDLIAQASEATTPEDQFAAYTELLTQLGEDVPYIPLMALKANVGVAPGFAWDSYTQPWWNEPWALHIKRTS